MTKPPTEVELTWGHDLVFSGRSGGTTMTLDSASVAGPSPMQAVAFGLTACMAMDLVHILKKGRHNLRGLRADLTGARAADEPRRFIAVNLHFTVTGDIPPEPIQRAIDLSREKYCSVWHSLRQDIPFEISFAVNTGR